MGRLGSTVGHEHLRLLGGDQALLDLLVGIGDTGLGGVQGDRGDPAVLGRERAHGDVLGQALGQPHGYGVVATRDEAKYAILGAMYGATTGESGRLVPRLARAFPHAMGLVDRAAREGERGGSVTTLLGRSSPPPSAQWRAIQARASEPEATSADERRARSSARDWGRFTRNFVVQGSAAEWSLCWMAALRGRLEQIAALVPDATPSAQASGPVFARAPHLVYFLHDEIIVHSPQEVAHEVAAAVEDAVREAGTLLFGDFPVEFPLDLAIVESYAMAGA